MRKGRRNLLLGGLVALALASALVSLALRPPEPAYQGRSLSEWLKLGTNGYLDPAAKSAIRHIGTNATPILLQMLRAHDSRLKLQLVGLLEKQHLVKLHFTSATQRNNEAAIAFVFLGDTARNAVPDLIQVFEEGITPESQICAIDSLGGIGPAARSAVPVLTATVGNTNANSNVRNVAAFVLAGQIRADPKLIVPTFIKSLKDPDPQVRACTALALGSMGNNATAAIPALEDALKDPDPMVKQSARQSLRVIDP